MKIYKWLVSIYPGNPYKTLLFVLGCLLFTYPLIAQEQVIAIPFKQSTQLRLADIQIENDYFRQLSDQPIVEQKKSASKAFFYSLLLPGTGEAYVGEEFQSKLFLGIEIVAWGLVIANIINVNSRESDYKNFAVQHAFLNRTGKDDQYWIDVGKFDTIYEYNEERLRERDVNALYPENSFYYWGWDNQGNRYSYDSNRIDTREIEQRRLYFYAAITLNHLVSAINALRLANSHNRKLDELSIRFNFDYNPMVNQFSFSLSKSF